jgi:hypothetical protein
MIYMLKTSMYRRYFCCNNLAILEEFLSLTDRSVKDVNYYVTQDFGAIR